MPAEITAEFDQASADALFRQMNRAVSELNRGVKSAMQWTAINLMKSLKAQTSVAPKRRKLLRATKERLGYSGKTSKDQRAAIKQAQAYAPYGVMKWVGGKLQFVQIEPKHTRILEITRKINRQALLKNLNSGQIVPESRSSEIDNTSQQGAKNSKLTKIRYSGLAKQSWTWAEKNVRRGGAGSPMGVAGAVGIDWTGPTTAPTVTIHNRLGYIRDAMKPGALDYAMLSAADSMRFKIGREAAKTLQTDGVAL